MDKYSNNDEKQNEFETVNITEETSKPISQRWRSAKRHMIGRLQKWFPVGSAVSIYSFFKTNNVADLIIKSVVGFFGGVILSYLCFMFFMLQLSISFVHATIMSSVIGVLLSLGLAFSYSMRCLVFLLIPQMFSRVGRYTLTCYALVLILTGPAANTLKNSEVLSESMACSQEQIKADVKQIAEGMNKPLNAIKETIKLMVDGVKRCTLILKMVLLKIDRMVKNIVDIQQSTRSWLLKICKICNQSFGTSYERCLRSLDEGASNCKATFGVNSWLCNVTFKTICWPVRPYATIFSPADVAKVSLAATVKRKLKILSNRIKTMLFIKMHIHRVNTFSNATPSGQMAAGIVTEIRNKADPIITWLSWSSCITSMFILLIICRAKNYQHMYETRCRFDNRYITKEFRELDTKRYREGRETVLPLNRREINKYVATSSISLVASEKVHMTRSAIFMVITTFKLIIHIIADYSLYWVLMVIVYHEKLQTPISSSSFNPGVRVTGSGLVSDLFRCMLNSLSIPLTRTINSPKSCLPNPNPPELKRYGQISLIIILLWFFALFEPYGLRLSHLIMGRYRPERAKARAAWLYNHILRTRGSFMKLARRKLHKEYKYKTCENLTFRSWMDSHVNYQCLRSLLGISSKELNCVLCSTKETMNTNTQLIRCEAFVCPGIYCITCFSDIGKLCTICLSPGDYGDQSDISLERDSSEEGSSSEDNDDTKKDPTQRLLRSSKIYKSKNVFEQNNKEKNTTPKINSKSSNDVINKEVVPLLCVENLDYNSNNCKKLYKTDQNLTEELCVTNVAEDNNITTNLTTYRDDNHYHTFVKNVDMSSLIGVANHSCNSKHKKKRNFKLSRKRCHRINIRNKYNNGGNIKKNINVCNRAISYSWKVLRYNIAGSNYYFIHLNMKSFLKLNSIHRIKLLNALKENRKNVVCRKYITLNDKIFVNFSQIKNLSYSKDKKESTNSNNKLEQHKHEIKECKTNFKSHEITHEGRKQNIELNQHLKKMTCRMREFYVPFTKLFTKKYTYRPKCTGKDNLRKEAIPSPPCTTNHKRRKKHALNIEYTKTKKEKKDNDNSRFYRISKYFRDQDWVQKNFSRNSRSILKEKKVVSEKSKLLSDLRLTGKTQYMCFNLHKCNRKIALENNHKTRKKNKLSEVNNNMNKDNVEMTTNIHCKEDNPSRSSIFCMLGRVKRYRSFGITNHVDNERCDAATGVSKKYLNKHEIVRVVKKENKTKIGSSNSTDTKTKNIVFNDKTTPSMKYMNINNVKLAISKYCLHLRLKNPLPIIKELYSRLETDKIESLDNCIKDKEKADKAVSVVPAKQSLGCQYEPAQLRCEAKSSNDNAVEAVKQMYSCATQYYDDDHYNRKQATNSMLFKDTSSIASISPISNGTHTETTMCSCMDYIDVIQKKNKTVKRRIEVVTKANQCTGIEKKKIRDVSTETQDWWSPIVERKDNIEHLHEKSRKKKITLSKDKSVATDGKLVKFKSRIQVLSPRSRDIMTPSRYLLESQKYYNEFFASKYYTPRVFPVVTQKVRSLDISIIIFN